MDQRDSRDIARGTFIVLEGTDGSGKAMQLQLLAEQLQEAGHDVAVFDFPQYDEPSSYFVKRYLNGDYGTAAQIGPYTGALFYALDRYDVADKIRNAINDGKIVLANRYSASSMAHQGAKFDNAEQRRGYFIWLDNLEFETLKIPRPDLNIVLRVPAEIAQGLVDEKGERSYTDKKRDIHEADLDHLRLAVAVYDDLCQLFPKDFARIDCVRSGRLLNIETINKLVGEKVAPLLPEPRPRPKPKAQTQQAKVDTALTNTLSEPAPKEVAFFIPEKLDAKTAQFYSDTVEELRKRHDLLAGKLMTYLTEYTGNTSDIAILDAILPVACSLEVPIQPMNAAARTLLDNITSVSHAASATEAARLIQALPRNELDVVSQLLYAHSNISYRELSSLASDWNYEQRSKVLTLFLNDRPSASGRSFAPLDSTQYAWEIISSYSLFVRLYQLGVGRQFAWQTLTPRLGFEVPQLIDDAGLAEEYEDCFDISLQFHSQLQQKGYDNEAQYATLQGHKLRWSVNYTASEMQQVFDSLQADKTDPTAGRIAELMHDKLTEIHPLIASALLPDKASRQA